jgi:hypothetical protein
MSLPEVLVASVTVLGFLLCLYILFRRGGPAQDWVPAYRMTWRQCLFWQRPALLRRLSCKSAGAQSTGRGTTKTKPQNTIRHWRVDQRPTSYAIRKIVQVVLDPHTSERAHDTRCAQACIEGTGGFGTPIQCNPTPVPRRTVSIMSHRADPTRGVNELATNASSPANAASSESAPRALRVREAVESPDCQAHSMKILRMDNPR